MDNDIRPDRFARTLATRRAFAACALCEGDKPLVESHVIPAFVFRWLKNTSGTGHLRSADNPKKRVQDGLKLPMLCTECEQSFNEFETVFSHQLFYLYASEEKTTISYGPWLLKFCVSVSWRVLTFFQHTTGLEDWSEAQREAARDAAARWKLFLAGGERHPGQFLQHLLPLGPIESSTALHELPSNMNRYFLRGVEMDIARGDTCAFTFAKLGRLAVFGIIEPGEMEWRGTKVHVAHGTIRPTQYGLSRNILDYLIDRAGRTARVRDAIPDHQRPKIDKALRDNLDKFAGSDLFKAIQHDVSLFGSDAVFKE